MTDYTIIELSKNGKKYKGLYSAIVDSEDADLDSYTWSVTLTIKKVPYAVRSEAGGKCVFWLHRIILGRMLEGGLPDHIMVDHIDGNPLNNRRNNLRPATVSQNGHNRKKNDGSTSGIKGVSWNKITGKWVATIMIEGKSIFLGYFKDKEDAAKAYRNAADRHHKEYARYE